MGVPAHLQVVPYETLLAPGESHNFRVRLYNAKGEFLRDAAPGEITYSVAGPGTVSPDGEYSAPTTAAHWERTADESVAVKLD